MALNIVYTCDNCGSALDRGDPVDPQYGDEPFALLTRGRRAEVHICLRCLPQKVRALLETPQDPIDCGADRLIPRRRRIG